MNVMNKQNTRCLHLSTDRLFLSLCNEHGVNIWISANNVYEMREISNSSDDYVYKLKE